ncbi:MAG: hypothetical protein O3A23_03810 [Proteobacteria bacterium]|nr:hypothetical protein [Pseudomonadota bacterium]
MGRQLIYVIAAICTTMTVILLLILTADPVANAGGAAHPVFAGMRIGGDGLARLETIGSLGYAFQALLLSLIVAFATLGVSERHRTPRLRAYMIATLVFSLFILWRMVASHLNFIATGETSYFMGFPTATAWAMYGVWLGGIPLVFIYTLGFRQFIYTDEDQAEFERLVAEPIAEPIAEGRENENSSEDARYWKPTDRK